MEFSALQPRRFKKTVHVMHGSDKSFNSAFKPAWLQSRNSKRSIATVQYTPYNPSCPCYNCYFPPPFRRSCTGHTKQRSHFLYWRDSKRGPMEGEYRMAMCVFSGGSRKKKKRRGVPKYWARVVQPVRITKNVRLRPLPVHSQPGEVPS